MENAYSFTDHVRAALNNRQISEAYKSEEFYYQKAQDKFQEFLMLGSEDVERPQKGNLNIFAQLILRYNEKRKNSSLEMFINDLIPGSPEFRIMLTIGQLIAYIDSNAANKDVWNQYEDKRTIARSRVYQPNWIINLLRFKAENNNINVVSPNIRHALLFLYNPLISMPVLSVSHRKSIANRFFTKEFNDDYFESEVADFFSELEIPLDPVNKENLNVVVALILYYPVIRTLWDEKSREKKLIDEDEEFAEEEKEGEREISKIIVSITGSPSSQSDQKATSDKLGRRRLIDALFRMISSPRQGTPFTIGIFGNWGSGKSSVVEMTLSRLRESNPKGYKFVNFNAWEYEHVDNTAAGLAQETVIGLTQDLHILRKLYLRVQFALKQHFWYTSSLLVGILIWGVFLAYALIKKPEAIVVRTTTEESSVLSSHDSLPSITVRKSESETREKAGTKEEITIDWSETEGKTAVVSEKKTKTFSENLNKMRKPENPVINSTNWLEILIGLCSGSGVLLFLYFLKKLSDNPLLTKFISNVKIPDYSDQLGLVVLLKKQVRILTNLLVKKNQKLIVFIDDLDRCSEDSIIKTFEAVRLVMDNERTIVIMAIDQRIALISIGNKYCSFDDSNNPKEDVARDYLGKLIQLPITLANPGLVDIKQYINEVLFAEKSVTWLTPDKKSVTEPGNVYSNEIPVSDMNRGEADKTESGTFETADAAEISSESSKSIHPEVPLIETHEEIKSFIRFTEFFRLINPRQIRRLRNSYRVLKIIEEGKEGIKLMFMLFLLEHLYSRNSNTIITDEVIDFDELIFTDIKFNDKISEEIKLLGIHNLRDLKRKADQTILPCVNWEMIRSPVKKQDDLEKIESKN